MRKTRSKKSVQVAQDQKNHPTDTTGLIKDAKGDLKADLKADLNNTQKDPTISGDVFHLKSDIKETLNGNANQHGLDQALSTTSSPLDKQLSADLGNSGPHDIQLGSELLKTQDALPEPEHQDVATFEKDTLKEVGSQVVQDQKNHPTDTTGLIRDAKSDLKADLKADLDNAPKNPTISTDVSHLKGDIKETLSNPKSSLNKELTQPNKGLDKQITQDIGAKHSKEVQLGSQVLREQNKLPEKERQDLMNVEKNTLKSIGHQVVQDQNNAPKSVEGVTNDAADKLEPHLNTLHAAFTDQQQADNAYAADQKHPGKDTIATHEKIDKNLLSNPDVQNVAPVHDAIANDYTHEQQLSSHNSQEHTASCFVTGTYIRTISGDKPIEQLQKGDTVITAWVKHRKITWIGFQEMVFSSHVVNRRNVPICIKAHAFSDSVPYQDLYVSPAHAFAFKVTVPRLLWGQKTKDILTRAGGLLNGRTIFQVPTHRVTYWHIELEMHDLLIANGAPAESYQDMGNRGYFTNGQTVMLNAHVTKNKASRKDVLPRKNKGKYVHAVQQILHKQERLLRKKHRQAL